MSKTVCLRELVAEALNHYFEQLDGEQPTNLYAIVLNQVELPLIQKVLEQTNGNRTDAAKMLGISRNTLLKKLRDHDID